MGMSVKEWKPFRFWWTPEWATTEVPSTFEPEPEPDGSLRVTDALEHGSRSVYRMPSQGWYFDSVQPTTMSDEIDLEDVEAYKARQRRVTDEELDFVRQKSEMLYRETHKALVCQVPGPNLGQPDSFTFADWMIVLATEKSYVKDLFNVMVEVSLENLRAFRDALGDRIEVAMVSGMDYGTQRGPLFSPEMFQKLFVPGWRRVNDWIHENTNWKTFFHSCGSVHDFIEHFIDMGVDILNPVQTSAAQMEPVRLQQEFGGRIVFWGGGVDTQQTLPFGTPDEVRQQVRERIATFGPGGGFVFNPVHNIQARVPTENMVAMFEAAQDHGRYPIVA